MSDPYWDHVVLLIQPEDTAADGSTAIIDRSPAAQTVSVFGNAQVDTSLGYPAVQLDGNGDYLEVAYATSLDIAGAYTVEALLSVASFSTSFQLVTSKGGYFVVGVVSPGSLYVNVNIDGSGKTATFASSITLNALHHIEIDFNPGNPTLIFIDGVFKGSLVAGTIGNQVAPLFIGRYNYYSDKDFAGSVRVRVTSGVARHTTTESFTPPGSFDVPVVLVSVRAELAQPWGIKLGADLVQPWANAPTSRAALHQPWGNAAAIRAELLQRWGSSFTQRAELAQGWHILSGVMTELEQRWAITAGIARGELLQGWDLRERDVLRAELLQRWAIEADGTDVAGVGSDGVIRYEVSVRSAGGSPIGVYHLNIEAGTEDDVLTCEIHIGTEADYLLCPLGAALAVTITSVDGVDDFMFVVISPRITEEHGNTQYIVEAMSPGVLLDESSADPVEGELSGLVSEIAASLAGAVEIAWQTVDWDIPPLAWISSGETPLTLLKKLAAAVGAVVQSMPDGSLAVVPEYEVSINRLSAADPGLSLVENLDCFATGATPEVKPGYNKFYIGEQMASADSLRMEEEVISGQVKLVRGYEVPWTGTLELVHTGGGWVSIEPMGVEERQETETIDIVAGSGRVQYPVYSLGAIAWGEVNLGSVTATEGGVVSATIDGESMLTITYTTRCRLWRATDAQNEKLLLVIP